MRTSTKCLPGEVRTRVEVGSLGGSGFHWMEVRMETSAMITRKAERIRNGNGRSCVLVGEPGWVCCDAGVKCYGLPMLNCEARLGGHLHNIRTRAFIGNIIITYSQQYKVVVEGTIFSTS